MPSVAIAGYTNAGKSSLLNRLTGAGVLVEDALFATLDPTTRRARTADGRVYTLSDTVGFVRHLPHQLVEAFRSTLEEVAEADLVVHVVDGAHPDPEEQVRAVREVLAEVGADTAARAAGGQQDRRGRRGDPAAAQAALAGRGVRLRPHRRAASTSCARRSRSGCRGRRSRCGVVRAVRPGRPGRPGAPAGRGAQHRAPAGGHRSCASGSTRQLAAELAPFRRERQERCGRAAGA